MQRTLRWAGLISLGFAGLITLFLIYQLFVTDLFNARSQAAAGVELASVLEVRRADLGLPESEPGSGDPIVPSTTSLAPQPDLLVEPPSAQGQPFGRMIAEKIGLDAVIFEGVDPDTLKLGPGHMPDTPLPGQPGNAVLSGHRTTYGRPFYDLDLLARGDTISIETALGINVYAVREILVVRPTDVWVTDPIDGAWLTLTTCNPRFSARERLIIQAELVAGPNFEYVRAITAGAVREFS
ncbi:MAG: sortase [Actinomycetota bacterium]